jgi:hypothetical protein
MERRVVTRRTPVVSPSRIDCRRGEGEIDYQFAACVYRGVEKKIKKIGKKITEKVEL